MTILISSHLLGEVQKMVSHVGIIYNGKMLFQGSMAELHLFQQKSRRLFINTSNNDEAMEVLQNFKPEKAGDSLSVVFKDVGEVAAINRTLTRNELDVYLLHPQENDLEQLFIELTSNRT